MPVQKIDTRKSGRIATAAGLRLVLARPAIVVRPRPMLLLLLAARTTRLAMLLLMATPLIAAAVRLATGYPVTGGKLDFQLDDFVPLLVAAVPLGNGQQFAQAASRIKLRRYRRLGLGYVLDRIFRIGIVHWKLKSGARH